MSLSQLLTGLRAKLTKKVIIRISGLAFILGSFFAIGSVAYATPAPPANGFEPDDVGKSCTYNNSGEIISIPYWYEYLPGQYDIQGNCQPSLDSISDIWLVVAAVVEILLRVAAVIAVVIVIYGGVQLVTSQGNPEHANRARTTITNALIGLVIAVAAAAVVAFLAGQF